MALASCLSRPCLPRPCLPWCISLLFWLHRHLTTDLSPAECVKGKLNSPKGTVQGTHQCRVFRTLWAQIKW